MTLFEATPNFGNFYEVLRLRASHFPERLAFTFLTDGEFQEECITYKTLDFEARKIAGYLQRSGVSKNAALLLYPPGLEYISVFFACLYSGVIAVPAYPPDLGRLPTTLPRLFAIIRDSKAKYILSTKSIQTLAKGLFLEESQNSIVWVNTDEIPEKMADFWVPPFLTGEEIAFLQYTSGATSDPKGVLISHKNLIYNSERIFEKFEHSENSQGVIWLPPYHDMGLIGGILQPVFGGFPCTLMSPFHFLQRPIRWLQAITRFKATTSGGPNFAYEMCINKIKREQLGELNLTSWDLAFCGAEPIRQDTWLKFSDFFSSCGFDRKSFYPCYGLAEGTLFVSGGEKTSIPEIYESKENHLKNDPLKIKSGQISSRKKWISCGKELKNHKIKIVNPESKKPCLENQVGEIWIAGPSIAKGYLDRVEETQNIFQAYINGEKEGHYLRTGDLGFLNNGNLYVTGRLKDLIIIAGQNHFPQDIELTVQNTHPALRPGNGAAFSVDIEGKERLIIIQELDTSHMLEVAGIQEKICTRIVEAHSISVYTLVLIEPKTIPKTSSGKVRRQACRELFLAGKLKSLNF